MARITATAPTPDLTEPGGPPLARLPRGLPTGSCGACPQSRSYLRLHFPTDIDAAGIQVLTCRAALARAIEHWHVRLDSLVI